MSAAGNMELRWILLFFGLGLTSSKNSILGDQYRWPTTVPYYLEDSLEKGYFMHFSTASAEPGERAFLETQWIYPKPGAQCLQFFLHNSGAADDVLNIWVREYTKESPSGRMKLFKSISGGIMGSWELHNINLNMTQKSRVVFEGVRGNSPSKGGFSLDDINLFSSKCPQHIWHIRNINSFMATTPKVEKLYRPRFLSPAGYSFQVHVKLTFNSTPSKVTVNTMLTVTFDLKLSFPS